MIIIVVGAQYGGEGKGKISAYLAKKYKFAAVCRCGGVNSSHTVYRNGEAVRLRLMPTAAAVKKAGRIFFGAGTLLHLPTFFEEMRILNVKSDRIVVDRNAGVITADCIEEQRRDPRYAALGSTLTGTGYATARRSLRALPLAKEFPELKPLIGDVAAEISTLLAGHRVESILVEGHQGFGLSNLHGDYPYVSSRDSTSAAMLSEIGIGPLAAKMRIVLAVKAFPTRNHPGQLPGELAAHEAHQLGIRERGGGSWGIPDNVRRVGIIDFDQVARAVRANSATDIALTGADYLDRSVRGVTDPRELSTEIMEFVDTLSKAAGIPVRYVSTGPETEAMVELPCKASSTGKAAQPPLPNLLH